MIREWTMPLFCPPAKQSTPVAVYDMHYCSSLYIVLEFNILWWYSFEYYLIRCVSTVTWIYETPEYHFFLGASISWGQGFFKLSLMSSVPVNSLDVHLHAPWHFRIFACAMTWKFLFFKCIALWQETLESLKTHAKYQRRMFDQAVKLVRPGGVIVYSTWVSVQLLYFKELVQVVTLAGSLATNAPKVTLFACPKLNIKNRHMILQCR